MYERMAHFVQKNEKHITDNKLSELLPLFV